MKTMKITAYVTLICSFLFVHACENALQEKPYSQIAPDNLLTNDEGLTSLLASAYGNANFTNRRRIVDMEYPTDILWQTGGGENRTATPMINFSWDASFGLFNEWYNTYYRAIRDANTLLDNVDLADIPESRKQQYIAEARFVRAFAYTQLYNWFGPTPLRTSTEDEMELSRASEEEMRSFIESELTAIIPELPAPEEQPVYGRATRGTARGVLTKFYLNTKQWQEAADMAEKVIDMGFYELFPSFMDMLKVENEQNREIIWVYTADAGGPGNNIHNATFPPGFQSWPRTGLEMQSNWNNWASQYRLRDDFYNSFEEGDERQDPIMTEYVNAQGDTVDLLNDFSDNTRSFRYWPDPNAQGNFHGNDYPVIRYADILLSRAEALNELNGPTQESIDLINEVRNRAGLDDILLAEFLGDQEALRDHILDERAWEFYYEGLRREDLIRHGKFIEQAQARGKSAQPHHVLFPIPQSAIDSNPLLEQNDGY